MEEISDLSDPSQHRGLGLLASRTENTRPVFKPPDLWHSVVAALDMNTPKSLNIRIFKKCLKQKEKNPTYYRLVPQLKVIY